MKDKKYHILAGLCASVWCALPAYLESLNLFSGLWVALWVGILVGGIKEYCDMRTEGNKFDWLDFGFTCLGAVIVALFIIMLHFGKG